MKIQNLKKTHLEIRDTVKYKFFRRVEFIGYVFFSFLIHIVMLILGKLLLVAESIIKLLIKPKTY